MKIRPPLWILKTWLFVLPANMQFLEVISPRSKINPRSGTKDLGISMSKDFTTWQKCSLLYQTSTCIRSTIYSARIATLQKWSSCQYTKAIDGRHSHTWTDSNQRSRTSEIKINWRSLLRPRNYRRFQSLLRHFLLVKAVSSVSKITWIHR